MLLNEQVTHRFICRCIGQGDRKSFAAIASGSRSNPINVGSFCLDDTQENPFCWLRLFAKKSGLSNSQAVTCQKSGEKVKEN